MIEPHIGDCMCWLEAYVQKMDNVKFAYKSHNDPRNKQDKVDLVKILFVGLPVLLLYRLIP